MFPNPRAAFGRRVQWVVPAMVHPPYVTAGLYSHVHMERPIAASGDPQPASIPTLPTLRKATQARGEAARRRILDVAWQAFAERGFRGTSFNEIAKAAGLTLAGLTTTSRPRLTSSPPSSPRETPTTKPASAA